MSKARIDLWWFLFFRSVRPSTVCCRLRGYPAKLRWQQSRSEERLSSSAPGNHSYKKLYHADHWLNRYAVFYSHYCLLHQDSIFENVAMIFRRCPRHLWCQPLASFPRQAAEPQPQKKRDATRCNLCFENSSFLGFGSRQSLCSAFCGANVHDQRRPGGLGAQRQAKTCQSPKKLHIVSAPPSSNPAHIVVLRFFKILRDQAARSHMDPYWSHGNQSHKTAETCHGVAIRIYVTLVFNCF